MSRKIVRTVAATAIALPLFIAAAPAASAAATSAHPATVTSAQTATPVLGSVSICVPLGYIVICV